MNRLREAIVANVGGSATGANFDLRRFQEQEWERNAFWLDASGLALYFLERMRSQGRTGELPPRVRDRLACNATDNLHRTQSMLQEFERVNMALRRAVVRFAALKGFTLFPDYCPNPGQRLQLDFDYLIEKTDLMAASAALSRLGYQHTSDLPFEARFATNPRARRQHADLYKPPASFTLEFHYSLFDRPELEFHPPQGALEEAREIELFGQPVPVLAEEDMFLHQIFHAFQDICMFTLRLSSLLEISRGVASRADQADFWKRVRARTEAADQRCGAMIGSVLALTAVTVGCSPPPGLAEWARPSDATLLWVREYGKRWALEAFPGNKLSLLLAREFMTAPLWRSYARKGLLPYTRLIRRRGAGEKVKASAGGSRHRVRRAWFHLREALRVAAAWPRWRWRLRQLRME